MLVVCVQATCVLVSPSIVRSSTGGQRYAFGRSCQQNGHWHFCALWVASSVSPQPASCFFCLTGTAVQQNTSDGWHCLLVSGFFSLSFCFQNLSTLKKKFKREDPESVCVSVCPSQAIPRKLLKSSSSNLAQ